MNPELNKIYRLMPVQGTDISLSVPIRYPNQPVESLVLQWRTSADVYVLQVKLFKDFQVAHVHPLYDESGKCVHDMSKQNHAFIIKGIISFETPERAWFIYESSVPLPEFLQKTSMARTTHSHKQQITENLILGFLERLREIHNMGLFHGRLRERGSLLIAERAIPKFGNFQGHSKTVIETRCDDEVEDLKAIKDVLKDALMPMKDILNSQVFGFVDSFIVNEFITSSKHLQSVHHHPTFLSEERLMEYIILTHERIQDIQAKLRIDLREIDVEIMKFESCQSWNKSVPNDYIDVLYFNREKWVHDTKPAYLNTPRGFLHFARNIGVHKKDKSWAEHGAMIVDTWPEMLSAFHQVMTCFDMETKLVK